MGTKYNFDKAINRKETNSYKWNVKNGVLSFTVADTDFCVADEIENAIIKRAKQPTYGYTFVPSEYFDAYIYWWNHRYELKLEREWFIFSTSVVASIDTIINRLTKEGDKISLFSPNYNVFYNCIENNNRVIDEVPFDYDGNEYSINWSLLEESIRQSKMFILCNPHNPIGKQFTKEELIRISEICENANVYLITDEIHSDLDYNRSRYNPLLKFTNYNKSIMLVSPGKSFNLAGLHSSVIIIRDKSLKEIVEKEIYKNDVGEPSFFSIEPVIEAYTKCEEYVIEENEYIKENKRVLQEFIVKNGLKLKIIGGNSTYLLWIDVSSYANSSDEFSNELLKQHKVLVLPGSHYHEHHSSFIRVNIATQRKNILHLCEALKEYCLKKGERK